MKKNSDHLYEKLLNEFIKLIEKEYKSGDKFISERKLCEKYNMSRTTVRQALDEIEKKGYIKRIQGKGTFIQDKKIGQGLNTFYSFSKEMEKKNKIVSNEVLDLIIDKFDDEIYKYLNLEKDKLICEITRVRKADNIPIIYEKTYIPYYMIEGIDINEIKQKSLYSILKEKFNIYIQYADEYFTPIVADELEAKYLNIKEKSPVLQVERISHTDTDIMEYTKSTIRADKLRYTIRLYNN